MADEGLFDNLKFTDILFPAGAAIASAYNPYIGYGLQTGLNVFNSMSEFQNNLRYWKRIKEQQERDDKALDSLRQGIDENVTYAAGLTDQAADNLKRGVRESVGQEGAAAQALTGLAMSHPNMPQIPP